GYSFATKLWNIARFVSSFPRPGKDEKVRLRPIDLALLAKLNMVIEDVDKAYGEELDVYRPALTIYDFTWNVFASHYIELVKARAYNHDGKYSIEEQRGAWKTLHMVLDAILRMLAPIMPFVTDALYRRLYNMSVHKTTFPQPVKGVDRELAKLFDMIMDINSAVWAWKKKNNIKFYEKLDKTLYVPAKLEPFKHELEDIHHMKVVATDSPPPDSEELARGVYIA
ncbi:MAG TPA: valine--tRNA ligase, partial [Pyrodictium sp.]|nr:valine--tRNA ligase [Pyrodictium sp.]